jgi:hypothetical protein
VSEPNDPLWTRDGAAWIPGTYARGPWDPGALHAGPIAGLIARELERLPAAGPMRWTRLTVEVFRPVPLAPLELTAEIVRPGRRVEFAVASLTHHGAELCRASGWRIRQEEGALAGLPAPEPPPEPGPEALPDVPLPAIQPAESFGAVTDQRWVAGDWDVGPGTVWMRLCAPLVGGETPTPFQRAASLCDYGNGISTAVSWEDHVFVNTDLTLYLDREPEGEWLCLDARTRLEPAGTGVAESALSDTRGRVGRSLQSLYAGRR